MKLAAAGLALAMIAAPVLAQPPEPGSTAAPRLEIAAHGEAKAAPDTATFTIGVEERAGAAAAALGHDGEAMARVIAALTAAGLPRRDLATAAIDLSPQYVYTQGETPRLTGYVATEQLDVRVDNLAGLGPAIDAAVAAGATNLGAVSLGLADPLPVEDEARAAAVKALTSKAALYAKLTGFRAARLVLLSEGAPQLAPPRPLMMAAMRAAAPTPVEPGETTVGVDVQGVFELQP